MSNPKLNLTHKSVTILGAQRSGMALAKLITKEGGKVRISEQASRENFDAEFHHWLSKNHIEAEFNGHTQLFIDQSDLLVLSPGVRIDVLPVEWAKAKGIPVLGEIEFTFQFCSKPVIAITGSNGKTTVTTLIHKVLEEAGYRSSLCGNIGSPFAEHVLDAHKKDFFVLEVSSFQMESLLAPDSPFRLNNGRASRDGIFIKGFKPSIAVFLNFSQNHLDRHKDLNEYFEAKRKIFLNQDKNDVAVLNGRDETLQKFSTQLPSQVIFFNTKHMNPNYSAASAVAESLGISSSVYRRVFENFKGVEHRREWIRNLDGIDFVNDSKATTPEATLWALNQAQQPILLICGGRDKKTDFGILRSIIQQKVKKIFAIGEATEKIHKTFSDIVEVEGCHRLEIALERAKEQGMKGDCVLLSPMCASFDMFRNFEERGQIFKNLVKNLKERLHA